MFTTDPIELGKRMEQLYEDQQTRNNLLAKSKRSFAAAIGMDPSQFNRVISGTGMSEDKIKKTIEVYPVSEEWLRFGKGSMYGQPSPNIETPKAGPTVTEKAGTPQEPINKPDLLTIIAESFQHQKAIDLLREQNRSKEVSTREREAENTSRLISLLEQQQLTGIGNAVEEISFLKKNDRIHFGHHSALREYVIQLAAKVHGSDYITQQRAVGKLESVALAAGEGKGMTSGESGGKTSSRKKTEKA
jgi:hypothetical protein